MTYQNKNNISDHFAPEVGMAEGKLNSYPSLQDNFSVDKNELASLVTQNKEGDKISWTIKDIDNAEIIVITPIKGSKK